MKVTRLKGWKEMEWWLWIARKNITGKDFS